MANKKESTFLTMTVTLMIVTVVAAFALGSVYNATKDAIAAAAAAKKEKAIKRVIPAFDRIETFMVMPQTGPDSIRLDDAGHGWLVYISESQIF